MVILVFKIVLFFALESIQAAEKLIRSSQVDNGDEDGSVAAIPPSVQTDLQLLELLIKSKIWKFNQLVKFSSIDLQMTFNYFVVAISDFRY